MRLNRLVATGAALAAFGLGAANAAVSPFLMQIGGNGTLPQGDYVSNAAGLNSVYRYFVEVTPGGGSLVIDVFDPDKDNTTWDQFGVNPATTFQVYDPTGVLVATLNCPGGVSACSAFDNAWRNLYTNASPASGHWEIRVDTRGGPGGANVYRLRAHDGNPGAGGVERNLYAQSYVPTGYIAGISGLTVANPFYPYVTSGCAADFNDFDMDSRGQLDVTSRTGAFSQLFAISGDNAWRNNVASSWTTDQEAVDYGIWPVVLSATGFGGAQPANLATFYGASDQAANPPPTAQPQPGAFRLYFATDAGGAPVKPYLTQRLTWSSSLGPNPPVVGTTSRFFVTVSVVNPTTSPITFSTPSNVVTSFVPASGGDVVYGGLASVSQGTLVSQPAVGGNGTISWNPGSVAAGSTAILTYAVHVTPSGLGTDPVTGNVGASGTAASFIDGTGAATGSLGQLCRLQTDTAAATHAVVSSLRLVEGASGPALEWSTASEAGTLGFYVYRYDPVTREYLQVTERLVPSFGSKVYRVEDETASSSGPLFYGLLEIETNGRSRFHGPWRVELDSGRARPVEKARPRRAGSSVASRPRRAAALWRRGGGFPDLKIFVREEGLYRVDLGTLSSASGVPRELVQALVEQRGLALERAGEKVPWFYDATEGALFFFGEARDSVYGAENVYWLKRGRGRPMLPVLEGRRSRKPKPPSPSYLATERWEQNVFAATGFYDDPDGDFWFWKAVSAGDPTLGEARMAVRADAVAPGGTARLDVELYSANTFEEPDEHEVEVFLGSVRLGESRWSGKRAHVASFDVPLSALHDGENEVLVRGQLRAGVPYSVFYVDAVSLTYPRLYRARSSRLDMEGHSGLRVTASGFTAPDVVVLDVSDEHRPKRAGNLRLEGALDDFAVSFDVSSNEARYFAASLSRGTLAPAAVVADEPSRWKRRLHAADYLVIAPAAFRDEAAELVRLREAQGLRSELVLLEDLYDEFEDGLASPHAIRKFLDYVRSHWLRAPSMVTLAGTGHYDYRGEATAAPNPVPPLLVATDGGLYASDLALVTGRDGSRPLDVAIARIPAETPEELLDYVGKLRGFERAGAAAWQNDVLLLADARDSGMDFTADARALEARVSPPYRSGLVSLDETSPELARAQALAALDRGVAFVHYYGHAAQDRLSVSQLLTVSDIEGLEQGGRLPVVAAMTCTVNRFEVPEVSALGEELTLYPEGGAIAVWSASGLSRHAFATELSESLVREAPRVGETRRLGSAVLDAERAFVGGGGRFDVLALYNLLGDAALVLKSPGPDAPPADDDGATDAPTLP